MNSKPKVRKVVSWRQTVKIHLTRWGSLALLSCLPIIAWAEDLGFHLHHEKPALSRQGGTWDSAYIDPGTVVFHDGSYHMFYVAIPRWPHPLAIGYAKSADGMSWDRQADRPILTHEQTGPLEATSIMSTSSLVTDDGTWVLFFTSVASGENFYGDILRATAPGPLGPWEVDPEPALSPGPKGAWDGVAVGDASVVRTENGYVMYYAGFGNFHDGGFSSKRANIGMATSQDGLVWTKYDDPETDGALFSSSDPVLSASVDDTDWDSFRLVDPNVQQTQEGWTMVYRGASFDSAMAVGLAVSSDGISWERASEQPIITKKDIGQEIYFATLVSRPDKDLLYLELGSLDRTDAYVATRSRLSD